MPPRILVEQIIIGLMNRSTLFYAILRATRPWALLAGVLLYALGSGMANYLGTPIDWSVYWLGQGAVTALQLSSYFLHEYFDLVSRPPELRRPPVKPVTPSLLEDEGAGEEEPTPPDPRVLRTAFIQVAATTLTVGAVLTVLLLATGALNPPAAIFLSISFVMALAYAVPPLRLIYSGYGELLQAILLANFFPALSFLFQTSELHRLLALMTFPLTFLFLSAALARSLRSYAEDMRRERLSMLVRLGWQRGMNLHNILILVSYLLLGISMIFGLPWRLALPAFFSLPVGLFQIWQIASIANGAKPRWSLLSLTAMSTIAFAVYFMNLALWTE
jgi:1,4-dihydroxy-2-naphthoate octaprenyltransferase